MKFNINDYETVEERIKRFYEAWPDGRLVTDWESSYAVDGASPNIWVVKAYAYLTAGDQANKLPKSTGLAFEKDGTGGANNTSALENAETSAIGRCLANMALSGNKRASREEMMKVQRESRDWLGEASKMTDIESLRLLWAEANAAKVADDILSQIKELASAKSSASGESSGSQGSVHSGTPKKASK
jgi:hypothetical protein